MSDTATISTAIRAAVEYFDQRIDVMCNVAGITVATPIDDLDLDQVQELNQINSVGPLQLISETLPYLPDGGTSVIVNVCSNATPQAAPTMAAYAGSKAALVSASLSLAIELAPRQIRVVPISPSGIQTKMMWDVWSQIQNYAGDWYSRHVHPWGQQDPDTPRSWRVSSHSRLRKRPGTGTDRKFVSTAEPVPHSDRFELGRTSASAPACQKLWRTRRKEQESTPQYTRRNAR